MGLRLSENYAGNLYEGADRMITDWQALKITNRQNISLSALLRNVMSHEKTGSSLHRNSSLVVVCHGFTGSKEGGGQAIAMGEDLSARGFSTLLFDFAGCGESEGNWEDLTLTGQIEDLAAVVEWCRCEGFSRIILTGRSFGGSTVLGYAARDRAIAGVCTWAAVARPDHLFLRYAEGLLEGSPDELMVIEGEEGKLELKRGFFLDLAKHDLLKCAAAVSPRSLLVLHGSADESVPLRDAELIYNAAAEPKKLMIIEGADHRFSNHIDQVWSIFFNWLTTILIK